MAFRSKRPEAEYPNGGWRHALGRDPVEPLLYSKNQALLYFVSRDLLGQEGSTSKESLWELPKVLGIVRKQLPSGAWKYSGGRDYIRSKEDYNQLETFRILRVLVEKYALDKKHDSIQRAASFLFNHQTDEGDFRGIVGNQYAPYYSAAIMELLIKAGYADGARILNGFRWLLSIRQDDGGWAFPLRTVGRNWTFR